jgi:predicted secreted Zn-dependent protease
MGPKAQIRRNETFWGALLLLASTACAGAQLDAPTRATLPHSSAPDVPEVEVSRSDASYEVSGASSGELVRSIREHARANWPDPDGAGLTNVQIGANMQCQEFSDGGALREAQIKLLLVVTLPSWQGQERAPAALRAAWSKFSAALRRHEEGHVEIALRHVARLRAALQAMKPEAACPDLLKRAEALLHDVDAAMMKEQLDYDATTNHGATQGCVL